MQRGVPEDFVVGPCRSITGTEVCIAMQKALDDLLCRRYPEIFRDRHVSASPTCMQQGFV